MTPTGERWSLSRTSASSARPRRQLAGQVIGLVVFVATGLLCALASVRSASAAAPPARRFAIVVGNDLGADADPPLRYARRDAEGVAQVLRELGGVRAADLRVLLGADAKALRAAFAAVDAAVGEAPAELVFYYSGHAGGDGLHLGASVVPWRELGALVRGSKARLRVAFVDACRAGTLVTQKGFQVAPALAPPELSEGTAIIVATSALENAQESLALGGSYFTHFLISGLRGVADANGDGLITLSEAHAYAAAATQAATAISAPTVQHPHYDFAIVGQREVVLADLRDGAARVTIASPLAGHVVIVERGASWILVEGDKRQGRALTFAVPPGRYLVHLRRPDAVYVAEVSLGWGGERTIDDDALSARSYQEIAQKGGALELYPHRLRLAASVTSPPLVGMGAVAGARLRYGWKPGAWEVGLEAGASWAHTDAVDTEIETSILGGGLFVCRETPWGRLDLRGCLSVRGERWTQDVAKAGRRASGVGRAGLGLGVRVPLGQRFFLEPTLEGELVVLRGADDQAEARPVLGVDLAIGWLF